MAAAYYFRTLPFDFEDCTAIELTETNRVGVIRKRTAGAFGFQVWIEGMQGMGLESGRVIHVNTEMMTRLKRGPNGSLILDA